MALPIILAEKSKYSDSFTKYTEALFEDIDLDAALKFADDLAKEAENDILLRPVAGKLRRAALLYVFEIQTRLYKSENDLNSFCTTYKLDNPSSCGSEIQANLKEEGLIVQVNDSFKFKIQGTKFDVKEQISTMTSNLLKRT